jgi:toxin ParE1/3/4
MRLRFTPHASRQLRAISAYLRDRSPSAGRKTSRRIQQAARSLVRFPNIGHKGALAGTYEIVLPDIPYVIVYRLERPDLDTLSILGVYHGAQLRPGQTAPETED